MRHPPFIYFRQWNVVTPPQYFWQRKQHILPISAPHIHCRNAAEKSIQTWKEHFIVGLSSVPPDFPHWNGTVLLFKACWPLIFCATPGSTQSYLLGNIFLGDSISMQRQLRPQEWKWSSRKTLSKGIMGSSWCYSFLHWPCCATLPLFQVLLAIYEIGMCHRYYPISSAQQSHCTKNHPRRGYQTSTYQDIDSLLKSPETTLPFL